MTVIKALACWTEASQRILSLGPLIPILLVGVVLAAMDPIWAGS